jgi:DNA-binding MarR family transcriptional regulator
VKDTGTVIAQHAEYHHAGEGATQVSTVSPITIRAEGGDGRVSDDLSRWPTGRLLGAAARGVGRDWNTHLESWNLNHASLPVLVMLAHHDHSQRELADAMDVTEQTMSRVLRRMERTGHVVRVEHPADRRRHVVRLTDAGRAVVSVASDPVAAEAIATLGLSPSQVRQLRELLVTMITVRAADPGDNHDPEAT